MLSGALTESPAIGTASEAISALSLPDEQKRQLIGHIAVADAICYIFGTLGVIWCCGSLGPKLLGIDLREESKNVEASLGIQRKKLGVSSAWQPIGFRAYSIPQDAPVVGKTIAEAEKSVPGARLFVERIRRKGEIFAPAPTTVVDGGDRLAVVGRTDVLIKVLGPLSAEVSDSELLEIPVASFDVYVTSKAIAGKTLQEISDGVAEARGVLLRGVTRGEQSLPIGTGTVLQRGDTLQVFGSEAAVERFAQVAGTKI